MEDQVVPETQITEVYFPWSMTFYFLFNFRKHCWVTAWGASFTLSLDGPVTRIQENWHFFGELISKLKQPAHTVSHVWAHWRHEEPQETWAETGHSSTGLQSTKHLSPEPPEGTEEHNFCRCNYPAVWSFATVLRNAVTSAGPPGFASMSCMCPLGSAKEAFRASAPQAASAFSEIRSRGSRFPLMTEKLRYLFRSRR